MHLCVFHILNINNGGAVAGIVVCNNVIVKGFQSGYLIFGPSSYVRDFCFSFPEKYL